MVHIKKKKSENEVFSFKPLIEAFVWKNTQQKGISIYVLGPYGAILKVNF